MSNVCSKRFLFFVLLFIQIIKFITKINIYFLFCHKNPNSYVRYGIKRNQAFTHYKLSKNIVVLYIILCTLH